MKNVAIIELASHLVYLETVVTSMKTLGCRPILFISEDVKEGLLLNAGLSDRDVEIFAVDFRSFDSVAAARNKISQCPLVLINTLTSKVFYLVSLTDFQRCIVTVHNAVSETFSPHPLSIFSLYRRLIRIASAIRLLFRDGLSFSLIPVYSDYAMSRRRGLARAFRVFVFHQNMIDMVSNKLAFPVNRMKLVPFNLPRVDEQTLPPPEPPMKIGFLGLAIIGIISFKRKNFEDILRWVADINRDFPVRLSIIGSFASMSDKKKLLRLVENDGPLVKIIGGERWASNLEAIDAIKESHFLLGAHSKYVRVGCKKESYGYTKASGAEFDACRHNRLLLRPSKVPATQGMEGLSITYVEEEGFCSEIREMLDCDQFYRNYKQFSAARDQSLTFLREKMHSGLSSEPLI